MNSRDLERLASAAAVLALTVAERRDTDIEVRVAELPLDYTVIAKANWPPVGSCYIAAIPGQVLPQRLPVARREGKLATQRWTICRAPDY